MKRFNRRIKKIASLLLVGILATGSLGACGKTSDKEDNKKVSEASAEHATGAEHSSHKEGKTDESGVGKTDEAASNSDGAGKSDGAAASDGKDKAADENVKVRHLIIGTSGTGPAPFMIMSGMFPVTFLQQLMLITLTALCSTLESTKKEKKSTFSVTFIRFSPPE